MIYDVRQMRVKCKGQVTLRLALCHRSALLRTNSVWIFAENLAETEWARGVFMPVLRGWARLRMGRV